MFQTDLLQLVQPFGVVTKLVMLRAKNQVFPSLSASFLKSLLLSVGHGIIRIPSSVVNFSLLPTISGSSPDA